MANDSTALQTAQERSLNSNHRPRSSATVRAELERTEQRLQNHLAGLRQELSLNDLRVAGMPVLDHVRRSPLLAVGLSVGVVAGVVILSGLGRRRKRRRAEAATQPMRGLVDQLMDRADARTGPSGDAEALLRRALRHRSPVIVVERADRAAEAKSRGVILGALVSTLRMASGYGLKFAMSEVSRGLDARRDAPRSAPSTFES